MWLLIDGYNLLFATDLVGQGRGSRWLEQARERLLNKLVQALPPAVSARTVIVFDSQQPSAERGPGKMRGIEVEFATDYPEADDLLEAVIKRHPRPKHLAVVSGDRRIILAAQRRRAAGFSGEEWYDALEAGRVLLAPGNRSGARAAEGSADEPLRQHSWLADIGLGRRPRNEDADAPTSTSDRPLAGRSRDPAESQRAQRQLDGDLDELFGELLEDDDDVER